MPRAAILLVEDAPDIARLVRRALTIASYDVAVAVDGRQAIDAFAGARPDLVLLDLMLPDIDGVEVCREMRRIEAEQGRARAPVLMLTALTSQHDREAGYEAGADDYLAKPFGITELLDRVAALAPDS